jgi:hypothetical protein
MVSYLRRRVVAGDNTTQRGKARFRLVILSRSVWHDHFKIFQRRKN